MTDFAISAKNKGRGILLFSNRKYLFALGTFLINLQNYVSYDGVIIYHDGFTAEEQRAIVSIEPKVRFIGYGLDDFVAEFGFDKEKLKDIFFINRYTVLAVVKFKIFQHLTEFSSLILFDLDMLILDRMDELLAEDFDVAWRNDGSTIKDKLNAWGYSDKDIREIGMYDDYNKTLTPNAGFIVVKNTFDCGRAYEECVKYIREYGMKHPYSIDEVMFGYVVAKLKLSAYYVDKYIYNVFPTDVTRKSKLIHFLADYKPWDNQMVQTVYRDWMSNYDKYVALTGYPSQEVYCYNNVSECIVQGHYQKNWEELIYKYGFNYPSELRMEPYLRGAFLVFSYKGALLYKIESAWGDACFYCWLWLEKGFPNISIKEIREELYKIASESNGLFEYQENEIGLGIRSIKKNIYNIPETFDKIYKRTDVIRNLCRITFCEIETYHKSSIYVNLEKKLLVHNNKKMGERVYVGIIGDKITMFINKNGKSLFIEKIDENGMVSLSGMQSFYTCVYNRDHSIAVEVKPGDVLSAEENGSFHFRHWNREWEHFYLQAVE